MNTNFKISQFSRFLLRSEYAIEVKIWKWLKLLNSVPFIKKTLVNKVYIRNWSFLLTFSVLHWLKKNSKIIQYSSFLVRSVYVIQVKFWKWLKLLNSFPFIKKTLVNQVYIRIWSFLLTFSVLQWMKKNSKISKISSFLLRSGYAILVKIWKWLKLLNSVQFMKAPLINHVYIGLWSSWPTFTSLELMNTNFKISRFSRFLLRSEYAIEVKIWKWLNVLNSVPFIKKTLVILFHSSRKLEEIVFTVGFDLFEWLSQFYSEWRQTSKLVNLKISAKVWICDFRQNLKMTKTSLFCCIHQERTRKSCLHLNLITLTDFHTFTVNEDKLQN